jgi:3-deoxy-D-manno-octulosonic-acid transferase
VTAAQVVGQRLPPGAIHQFAPVDTPAVVSRFLDHWRPGLALFAESELWPTTLNMLAERGVPTIVVNARMSDRSFRRWRRLKPLASAILSKVELFIAQSSNDAIRLRELADARVITCGNLKFDVPPPQADEARLTTLRRDIGERRVLLAASTHPGEEAAIITAHLELARAGFRLLTTIAPRHPHRGHALMAEIAATPLSARCRSAGEEIPADTDIFIVDRIGEMGFWYRLADLAFLGGSLVAHGGQNPIEAAKLGVPILHGPHVGNFRDVYGALSKAGAAQLVHDGPSLAAAARALLQNPAERERMAREAHACVDRSTGALERTLEALEPYLAALRRAAA